MLDFLKPGILAGRLIKMTVNTNIAVQNGPLSRIKTVFMLRVIILFSKEIKILVQRK